MQDVNVCLFVWANLWNSSTTATTNTNINNNSELSSTVFPNTLVLFFLNIFLDGYIILLCTQSYTVFHKKTKTMVKIMNPPPDLLK